MAILKVARLGHPVLRQPCRELAPAEIVSEPIRRLVRDMHETMIEYSGVGIAAPQVHEPVRLALIEFDEAERYEVATSEPLQIFFNPRVTVLDETLAGFWEGCLSVPGLRGWVERPSKVQVDYLDFEAKPRSLIAEGFLATVCQHEFDHLEGSLYVDRIADPTRFAFNEEFARYHQEAPQAAAEGESSGDREAR